MEGKLRTEGGLHKQGQGRIEVYLNDRSFEYDVYTLLIAFYPGTPVRVGGKEGPGAEGIQEVWVCIEGSKVCARARGPLGEEMIREETAANLSRICVKNALKRTLYRLLSDLTGRDLPWGNLTGIRPVKIAMDLLREEEASRSQDRRETGCPAEPLGKSSDKGQELFGTDGAAGDGKENAAGRREQAGRAASLLRTSYYVSPGKADLAVEIALREQAILDRIHPEEGYSLYIGIPFCPSICLYCSFSSGTIGVWQKEADHYVDTLIREIEACGRQADRPCFPDKSLTTIYMGGGTPTTLTAGQLDRLLAALEENFDTGHLLEYTVEAGRPDTITEDKLSVCRKHGVSRISINPQTMNQKTLDLIGRKHTVEQTVDAYRLARSMHFAQINMDLIVGLPGEGLPEVDRTMGALEDLGPDDITVHALALKRAARLALHMDEYEAISFRASDDIMKRTEETSRRLGMTPYYLYRQKNMAGNFENVGYAKAGCAGLYNILIMEEAQSILALGASGSTKRICPGGRIERIENVKDVRSYLDRIDEMIRRKDPLR